MTDKRATLQRATIGDENGKRVTYWGINLSTFQLLLGLLGSIAGIMISIIALVGPWVDSRARSIAEERAERAVQQTKELHDRDVDAINERIKAGDELRREVLMRLDRIEGKIDAHVARPNGS